MEIHVLRGNTSYSKRVKGNQTILLQKCLQGMGMHFCPEMGLSQFAKAFTLCICKYGILINCSVTFSIILHHSLNFFYRIIQWMFTMSLKQTDLFIGEFPSPNVFPWDLLKHSHSFCGEILTDWISHFAGLDSQGLERNGWKTSLRAKFLWCRTLISESHAMNCIQSRYIVWTIAFLWTWCSPVMCTACFFHIVDLYKWTWYAL